MPHTGENLFCCPTVIFLRRSLLGCLWEKNSCYLTKRATKMLTNCSLTLVVLNPTLQAWCCSGASCAARGWTQGLTNLLHICSITYTICPVYWFYTRSYTNVHSVILFLFNIVPTLRTLSFGETLKHHSKRTFHLEFTQLFLFSCSTPMSWYFVGTHLYFSPSKFPPTESSTHTSWNCVFKNSNPDPTPTALTPRVGAQTCLLSLQMERALCQLSPKSVSVCCIHILLWNILPGLP